jgi:2-phosphosulfolactate phosphatase
MKFHYRNLEDCHLANGVVVVIDVIRAFTCAAFVLGDGAKRDYLVGEVEEALQLRKRFPNSVVMGEVEGIKVPQFDFGNSPHQLSQVSFQNKTVIQRTTSGTQGVVRSRQAQKLFAASFCVAQATAQAILNLMPEEVTFVSTGIRADGRGDEDVALADYLALLLNGKRPDPEPFLDRVKNSIVAGLFHNPEDSNFPAADIPLVMDLDRFNFAMPISWEEGIAVIDLNSQD